MEEEEYIYIEGEKVRERRRGKREREDKGEERKEREEREERKWRGKWDRERRAQTVQSKISQTHTHACTNTNFPMPYV